MIHPKLKPTEKFNIDFNPRELNDIEIPEESKIKAKEYIRSLIPQDPVGYFCNEIRSLKNKK